mmetsp:Transcript_32531/g.70213  ORF Transcript_32531/g.70213 Transcript_32531/m.70213 type:complete len:597 (-) Transcript_32531:134-1924(-)
MATTEQPSSAMETTEHVPVDDGSMQQVEAATEKKEEMSMLKKIADKTGMLGDFRHLNFKDPFLMKEKNSRWWREVRAGTVTFLTMAYILPVNANLLGIAIPYKKDLVIATAAAGCIGSLLMGILSNFPFGLAPGMGLNAYFVYNVVLGEGLPWQEALTAVLFSGFLFLILTLLGLRTFILKFVPPGVQLALGAGIGLFLAFIGLQVDQGMGLIKGDPVTLVTLNQPLSVSGNYDASKMWVSVLVLVTTVALMAMNVRGAQIIGILFGTLIGWSECFARGQDDSIFLYPFDTCSPQQLAADLSNATATADGTGSGFDNSPCYCYAPQQVAVLPEIKNTAGAFTFGALNNKVFWIAVVTFFYNDLISCAGTMIAVTGKAKIRDEKGNLPVGNTNMGYLADSIGTIIGACLGTSTVTSYVESAAGVVDGGRTGLVGITVGVLFGLSTFFAPLISQIPYMASSPILAVVGALMCTSIQDFNWSDVEESVPAFACLIMIPLTYNIAFGIISGVGLWVIIQLILVPYRLARKEDPFVKFKMLFEEELSHDKMCAASCGTFLNELGKNDDDKDAAQQKKDDDDDEVGEEEQLEAGNGNHAKEV